MFGFLQNLSKGEDTSQRYTISEIEGIEKFLDLLNDFYYTLTNFLMQQLLRYSPS